MAITPTWILCTYRTGSTFLAKSLNDTNLFDPHFKEHFKKHQIKSGMYNDGVPQFAKVHRDLFLNLFDDTYDNKNIHEINKIFPDIKFIHLRRKNIIDQAISHYISHATQKYVIFDKKELKEFQNININFDAKEIYRLYKNIKKNYDAWLPFLSHQKYIDVYYEDLVRNSKEIFDEIMKFIGIENTDGLTFESYTYKQKHPQKDDIEQNFLKYLRQRRKRRRKL